MSELEKFRNDKMLSVKEAVEYIIQKGYPITEKIIYHAREDGHLPGEKNSLKWMFAQSRIDEFIEGYLAKGKQKEQSPESLRGEIVQVREEQQEQEFTPKALVAPNVIMPPSCHRCQRVFEDPRQYTVKQFVENNMLQWFPVCADGWCDPQPLKLLKRLRHELDRAIAEYQD